MKFKRLTTPLVLASAVTIGLAGCAQSDRESTDTGTTSGGGTTSDGGSGGSDTFTFGAAGAPEVFDPYYASDGETFRITRQMFQGLLGIKPGSADPQPELAESWESSEDGLEWTFKLRQGVKFTDGEAFNAAAVCANFERMYDQNEVASAGPAEYWAYTMLGFKKDAGTENEGLYKGCEAPDDTTAKLTLTRYTSDFPVLLTLESFSMQSPKALESGDANNVTKEGEGFKYPANAQAPVGTGPYKLEKYDQANKTVTLVRNDDFWGEKAKTAKLVFKIIPDESTRRQELEAGSINAYDLPNPVDWKGLEDAGNQVLIRPAFNILYMGLNPEKNAKLKDLKVRQAIYHALNRDQLVATQLPEGAKVATQFMPDTVAGYNTSLQPYAYDVEKSKALLKEAGAEGLELTFAYPSEVSRPYMPDPQKIHDALRADLEAVGIKVNVVTKPWNGGYLDGVDNGQFDAWLLGWTGDYNSANNFIGTFFASNTNDFHTWGADFGKTLSKELDDANGVVDEGERTTTYEAVNQKIMEDYLPGLPISHSPPALVVGKGVEGLTPSPLTAEMFDTVTVTGS